MQPKEPSRTAFAAAAHRAAHQLLEGGRIFADPYAVAIAGIDADSLASMASADDPNRAMRLFVAARSHFAEAKLAQAVEAGRVGQLVVLGAGLDTFAWRNPFADRLRVFEVDHPATQAWKRQRIADLGLELPPSLVFAPVDFEQGRLVDGLAEAGFDPEQRSFFSWLGVIPYLTESAIWSTLETIEALPGGGEVVFDYGDPPATLPPEFRAMHDARAARVASLGEPFLTWFEPPALRAGLSMRGFSTIEDLGPQALRTRYFGVPARTDAAADRGGHVVFAATDSRT